MGMSVSMHAHKQYDESVETEVNHINESIWVTFKVKHHEMTIFVSSVEDLEALAADFTKVVQELKEKESATE